MRNYPGIPYMLTLSIPTSDGNVKSIETELCKQGFLDNKYVDGWFDLYTERSVKNFQSANGMSPTGIVDKATWDKIFIAENVDTIIDVSPENNGVLNQQKPGSTTNSSTSSSTSSTNQSSSSTTETNNYTNATDEESPESDAKYDGSEKHTPHFNEYNSEQLRKTGFDIKISFGANSSMNKTIKKVYMRSSSIEVDASGNPIYQTFDFIAQDLLEPENKFTEK